MMPQPHRWFPLSACALLLLLTATGCVNLHAVEEGKLYRSAQPEGDQLRDWIYRYDIETVLRLRGGGPERQTFRDSNRPAVTAGIDFIQRPMSANRFPEKAELRELCHIYDTARKPILVHCRAGADRTGLAAAVWWLHTTGDVERARQELSLRYLHTGWPSTHKLDETVEMYAQYADRLAFYDWVEKVYERPANDEADEAYFRRQQALAAIALAAKPE